MSAARRILVLALLPATIAHELAHAIAALPWAERIGVWVEPDGGGAAVDVELVDGAPHWGVALAAFAPMWSGLVGGAALVAWVLTTATVPTGLTEWATAVVVAVWWGHYTLPSAGDRAAARGASPEVTS